MLLARLGRNAAGAAALPRWATHTHNKCKQAKFVLSFVRLFAYSFAYSLAQWFVYSFVRLQLAKKQTQREAAEAKQNVANDYDKRRNDLANYWCHKQTNTATHSQTHEHTQIDSHTHTVRHTDTATHPHNCSAFWRCLRMRGKCWLDEYLQVCPTQKGSSTNSKRGQARGQRGWGSALLEPQAMLKVQLSLPKKESAKSDALLNAA